MKRSMKLDKQIVKHMEYVCKKPNSDLQEYCKSVNNHGKYKNTMIDEIDLNMIRPARR